MESEFVIRSQSPIKVTTKVDTKPASPIPNGLATFTVYAQISQDPEPLDSLVEMKIYVPEEVCAANNLGQLAIYSYDASQGWTPLQAQELDAKARVISARDRRPRTYAVLGPSAARIKTNPFARQMVAKAVPDAKPLIQQAEAELPPPQSASAPPPQPQDMVTAPAAPMPVGPPSDPTPAPAADQDAAQSGPASAPAPLVNEDATLNTEPQEPVAAGESKRSMPVMQMGLPTAPTAAPKGAKEGALAWGQKMQLRPPGVEGLVMVSAKKQVGARVVVLPEPEQSLPPGLASYTQFVKVEVQSEGTPVELTVHLRAPGDSVAAAGLSALKLYAFDPVEGWVAMADQSRNDEKRDFQAKDTSARTYALLGPAELLQKQAAR
jgi:hypothetical protein